MARRAGDEWPADGKRRDDGESHRVDGGRRDLAKTVITSRLVGSVGEERDQINGRRKDWAGN